MCSESSRQWRSPILVVVALVLVCCARSAGAQPVATRAEAAANSVHPHQSQGTRGTNHPQELRILCGSFLRDELARVCKDRGYYNGGDTRTNTRVSMYGGAAKHCCNHGCTWQDLDSYCNPKTSDSSDSVEEVTSYAVENAPTSNNQLRNDAVVQENPRSISIRRNPQQEAEAENALRPIQQTVPHTYYVKTNDVHQLNGPVTPRRH